MTDQDVEDLAYDLTQMIENSWHRFCRGLDSQPQMWPASIRMKMTVRPDAFCWNDRTSPAPVAVELKVYPATSNLLGAVCAVIDGELLGVKPAEFEIETWVEERPCFQHFAAKKKARGSKK